MFPDHKKELLPHTKTAAKGTRVPSWQPNAALSGTSFGGMKDARLKGLWIIPTPFQRVG